MSRPKLYDVAEAQLNGRDSRKIGNNTYLERRDARTIAVRLHSTDVLTITPTAVVLDSGGWHTPTTWDRMSDYGIRVCSSGSKHIGIVVYPVDSGWDTGGFGYYDGITLTADGTALAKTQPAFVKNAGPVLTRSGFNGMTRSESRQTHNRMWDALSAGNAAAAFKERDRLGGPRVSEAFHAIGQTLQPDRIEETALGTAAVYTMNHSMIVGCPHLILVPEHYRADGTCRCNDATHTEMREWEYVWSDSESRWI